VPAVAATVAGVIIAQASGGAAPSKPAAPGAAVPKPAVLTAASVNRISRQSRHALAQSGKVTISYRQSDNGTLTGTGSDRITFAGQDWNDVITQHFPASGGAPASSQSAINRIVSNQLYLYIDGPDNQVRWYHDTNPSGHPSFSIPDPRTLLSLLSPSAGFEVVGHQGTGPDQLTELRATQSPEIRPLSWLPGAEPGAQASGLTVWVDAHNVVHQMSLSVTQKKTTDPIGLEKRKDGTLVFVVPSKAYLKKAQAMARKVTHEHAIARVDPTFRDKVDHDDLVSDVTVKFGAFGQTLTIPVPKNAVDQFSQG
jgi:hypothetical protein